MTKRTETHYWTVMTWQGGMGRFSRREDAREACRQRREADKQAGNMVDARVVRVLLKAASEQQEI
jgi:hypothetical protein